MRFAVGLAPHHPIPDEFASGEFLAEFGRAAEAAGFDAVYLTEHPIPQADWLHAGGHDALDPFVALACVAAATSTIGVLTNLTVLPYRNPFLLAKAAATLDRVSGGRLTLGVGVGYQTGEFAALGVPFDDRNERFDESLTLLRSAWSGDAVTHDSPRVHASGNIALPRPVQDPVPIWIGGNARLTLRRVAAAAQGWMPLINPRSLGSTRRSRHLETRADLLGYIAELRDECARIGRVDPVDIAYLVLAGGSPLAPDFDVAAHIDGVAANEADGVTWNICNLQSRDRAQILEGIMRYGEDVIRTVKGSANRP